MTFWKTTEIQTLRAMWPGKTIAEISECLPGRSGSAIKTQASKLGLGPASRRKRSRTPPPQAWITIATQCANEAGVSPVKIMAGQTGKRFSIVRWRAWRLLLDSNPRWSLAGVGRATGHDHTSVRSGLKRLEALGVVR